jgi:hypothetical protein
MTPQDIREVFLDQCKSSRRETKMNRQIILSRAYNDMLFLCEKYAPLETLEKYNPKKDISVTGAYTQHSTQSMKDEYLNG